MAQFQAEVARIRASKPQPVFIPRDTLDTLAEQILMATHNTADADGKLTGHPLNFEHVPAATITALNVMFGEGKWAPLEGDWPRPEQLQPIEVPPGLEGIVT